MKFFAFVVLLLVFSSTLVFGQSEIFYQHNEVTEFHITIARTDSISLFGGNPNSDFEHPAKLVFKSSGLIDSVENIGFRFRGNTSRNSAKKSFKISINSFERGKRFYGIKDFNLNGEHNDPSLIRAALSWDLISDFGIPGSRFGYSRLYVNGTYMGLYLNLEHINDDFLDRTFGEDSGNLYKCLWPADLTFRGNNPNDYKFMVGGRRTYELKTNEDLDDYSDLASFIAFINNASTSQFERQIESKFNVDGFLRYLAVTVLTGSWDSYWQWKNNFYLYNNQKTGRFEFIPYDYDNSYGIDWIGFDWAVRSVYEWGHDSEQRPLANRILAIEMYRNQFAWYVKKFAETFGSIDSTQARSEKFHRLINSSVENDVYRTLDWGFTYSDFTHSLKEANGGHVKYGILPYVEIRNQTAFNEIGSVQIRPFVQSMTWTPNNPLKGRQLSVAFQVGDDKTISTSTLYVHSDSEIQEFPLQLQFSIVADGSGYVYVGQIPAQLTNQNEVQLRVEFEDSDGNKRMWPGISSSETYSIELFEGSDKGLYINEFLASNSGASLEDEFGESDDWIEIFNDNNEPVSLEGYFITDNISNPDKFQLPNISIPAKSHLIIWADNQPEQGALHTDFGLSNNGEEIGLFFKDGEEFVVVDTLTFGPQVRDISFGRVPDGGDLWRHFETPTPGESNGTNTSAESDVEIATAFTVFPAFPNPFNPQTQVRVELAVAQQFSVGVFDLFGRQVSILAGNQVFSSGQHLFTFDGQSLASGPYFIRFFGQHVNSIQKVMLVK